MKVIFFSVCITCVLLFMFDSTVLADTGISPLGGDTVVSKIVTTFSNQLSKYEAVMLKYAKVVFYWCAVLEVAWLGVRKALGASDMGEMIREMCFIFIGCGFFLAVINNYHEWAWNIINGLKHIAGEATSLQEASDKPFTVGLDLAQKIFDKIGMFEPARSLAYVLAGMAVLICFALITMQIILIKCECIVAMCASAILLGLGASSFFREYAINTLRYVFAVAFKLMTMQLVIGVGMNFIQELLGYEDMGWAQIGVTISFCIIFYCLVKTLPDVVAGIIQGSHVSTGGSLGSTVTAMGAGLAGAGIAAAAGAANIGRAAKLARAEGAQGLGVAAGTVSNLWNASKEARINKNPNTVASALRERIMQANSERQ